MESSKSLLELMISCGIGPRSREGEGLQRYLALLAKWNLRVNLTASTAWPDLRDFFAEALWAARFYPRTNVEHIDIGSGAGFPAIPMRIVLPSMKLRLVETRAKRAAFLETLVAELRLGGTEVFCGRIEDWLGKTPETRLEVVSWKGVKLGAEALELMRARGDSGTRLWLFHGKELPLENPAEASRALRLLRRESFYGREGWLLSIYAFR
jgi:16S rRNA (guanine(527)-N(7))-methyltransferase RsmG